MNAKAVAVLLAAVLAAGAAAVLLYGGGGDDGGEAGEVVIVDDAGKEFRFDGPVDRVAVSNSAATSMIEILGQEGKIVAVDSDAQTISGGKYAGVADIGGYKTPSGEEILKAGAHVLICKSGARTLTNETELNGMGIDVIRLDCFGETMLRDMEQLVALLGGSARERADMYLGFYEPIIKNVTSLCDGKEGPSFLFMFTSMKKPYSAASEISKIAESIGGRNALRDMGDDGTGKSASSIQPEKIYDYDRASGIDVVILRSATGGKTTEAYASFLGIDGFYGKLSAVERGDVYIVDTDVLSGPLYFIGYICIAEAMGLDTGYDADALMEEFNGMFGFSIPERDYLYSASSSGIAPVFRGLRWTGGQAQTGRRRPARPPTLPASAGGCGS